MWLFLTLECLHFHSLSVFFYSALERNLSENSHSVPVDAPWPLGGLSALGAAHQVGTGADSSTGFSSSVCAQAKAHSNSLIVPAGFSGQGKAVVGQLHPATCSRLCKALCHLLWSLQTQHPLPCSLHLSAHLPSVLPSSSFSEASSPYTTIPSPLFHSQSINLPSQTPEMEEVSNSFLLCLWYLLQSSLTESFPDCPFNVKI